MVKKLELSGEKVVSVKILDCFIICVLEFCVLKSYLQEKKYHDACLLLIGIRSSVKRAMCPSSLTSGHLQFLDLPVELTS